MCLIYQINVMHLRYFHAYFNISTINFQLYCKVQCNLIEKHVCKFSPYQNFIAYKSPNINTICTLYII